jgi:hypothetical protein
MKKLITGFLVTMSIVIAAIFVFNKNDYTDAKKFAEAGQYKAFYENIENKLNKNDKVAFELLMEYFIQAVQDGDLDEVKYYLEHDKSLIDAQSKDEARAIDAVLIANEVINMEMLEMILSYHPKLNYTVPYFKNMSPLQMVSMKKGLNNGVVVAKLFLEGGASPDYCIAQGPASSSALVLSYINDNFDIFQLLLQNGASLKQLNGNSTDLFGFIAASYVIELKKYFPEIKSIYVNSLKQDVLSVIQNESYRIVHAKNMNYLKVIFELKSLNEANEDGLLKLAQYFSATNEVHGMKLMINHGLCNIQGICEDVLKKASLNNNRAIIALIRK